VQAKKQPEYSISSPFLNASLALAFMTTKPYLIPFHFHGRRTGVTRSVEAIMPGLQAKFHAVIFGYGIDGPKVNLTQLLKIVFGKTSCIIHVHRNNEMMFALLLRWLGGKFKLIASRHSETKPSAFTIWLLRRADAVIALIPTLNLPIPTVVIGHGIDTNYLVPVQGKTLEGINHKNIISVVGRVRKAKGQAVFIEAVAPLLKENKDWCAVIVGKIDDDAFKKGLDEIIAKHSIESQVYFLNETRDILSIYQASQIVVVPSFSEGFSLVPLEAMSCGCIVIASAGVGIHSSLIKSGENGFLFEKGNAQQLNQILKAALPANLSELKSKARKTVVSEWDITRQVEALSNLYLAD
jgi:glycosyltransferase involved in cell wall biosynthesis